MRKENLISMVEDRKAELIDLVSRLIRINSENPTGTQREVVDFVEKYLEKAGIAYEETGENPDYPCVVARMGSEDGYSLIFNGHVDVVPAGDRGLWDFDPFCGTVTDSQILGRGTSDMKAGGAGGLFALAPMSALRGIYGFTLFLTRRAAGSTDLRGCVSTDTPREQTDAWWRNPPPWLPLRLARRGECC